MMAYHIGILGGKCDELTYVVHLFDILRGREAAYSSRESARSVIAPVMEVLLRLYSVRDVEFVKISL